MDGGGSDRDEEAVRTVRQIPEDGSVVVSVVSAVAEATGTDPREIDPLAESVDLSALSRLVRQSPTAGSDAFSVTFDVEGHRVTVEGDRRVTVRRGEGTA